MKKSLFLFVAAFCAVFSLFAQAPTIEWQNTIGGTDGDAMSCVRQTTDGGYIISGVSDSDISDDKSENCLGSGDYWVVKVDANGNIQWENTIGGTGDDGAASVQQTTDGGYIVGGASFSDISGDKTENSVGNYDYWVVKLDADGNIQWQNTIGGDDVDEFNTVQQTTDGGYIIGGSSVSAASADKTEDSAGFDYWVLKLDTDGNIQWQNTIGGNGTDHLNSMQQTVEGGYIIGGTSNSNISGDKTQNSVGEFDYWIVKLNATGTIQWQKTIGGSDYDALWSLQQTMDGGYILSGTSSSNISGAKTENRVGDSDYWVVKLDAAANIEWQNTIGGDASDDFASIQKTAEGGYLVSGSSFSDISGDKTQNSLGYDCWLVKLSTTGNIEWQKTIGGDDYDPISSVQQTADGGYVLGATSLSNISGDKTENNLGDYDYWLIKLSPELVPTTEPSIAQTSLEIYPNPITDAVFVRTEVPTHLSLYNAFGQMILTRAVQDGDKIELSSLPNGLYFLMETTTGQAHKVWKSK